jgi:hypothetical protein
MTGITQISRDWGDNVSIVRITTTDTLATASAANYILNQAANIALANNGAFTWLVSDMTLVYASNGWMFASISANFQSLNPLVFNTTLVGSAVVGDFAVFASTGGNLEDLGYLPSNPAYTNVVMANTPTVSGQLAMFNDTAGSITDSGLTIVDGSIIPSVTNAITAHAGGGQTLATALTTIVNRVTTVATAGDSIKLPASVAGLSITVINSGANPMQVFGAGTDTINGVATATGVSQLPNSVVRYVSAVAGLWQSQDVNFGFSGNYPTVSYANNLTAHAGGTQAAALPLTASINVVTTVATAADSVRLPASAPGMQITVTNNGANAMQVYGAGTDTINGIATATGVSQSVGSTVVYRSVVAGNWIANLVAASSTIVLTTAVNTMAAGSEIILDKTTGTVSGGAVTINKQSGVITTTSLSTASGAAATVTLTNSEISSTSVILCQVQGGSNTTAGITIVATPTTGSATILLQNTGVAAVALNGTVVFSFVVF